MLPQYRTVAFAVAFTDFFLAAVAFCSKGLVKLRLFEQPCKATYNVNDYIGTTKVKGYTPTGYK